MLLESGAGETSSLPVERARTVRRFALSLSVEPDSLNPCLTTGLFPDQLAHGRFAERGVAVQDAVIVITRSDFLILAALLTVGWLLLALQFWFTFKPTRGIKIGLALSAVLLVGTTAWSFARLL